MQQIVEEPIATYLPSEVVYFDGTSAILLEDYVLREGNLRLFVPKNKIEDVVNSLKTSGFHEEKLEFYKGEKFSLAMKFYDIWELHIRIYEDGFIDAHFEVSRDYLEHLNYATIPSIYEPFEFYRSAYNNLHIFDGVAKKWIKEVRSNYLVTLNPPKALTPWKPISVIAGALAGIGIIAYALSRLGETSEN
ncbi:hypothetical protein SULI_12790 [Saccharolobus solfataricus]|uniref:Uncharacterized protein n=2 Tax=Saccharolobus solfataricus TaxID=2287 RepID=A0A0E3K1I1_SACSO|nr:hypothetical protein [Saccharolobus solfataricus]AKA74650.1 hypothetical protein SULB_2523 [Saccharolobus solfataricus]AKA77344.1 hypothetical protein SULC_2518 [Saccharolobus solfataricus]AKA80035.1 hypothetical protein SULA_2520 [Saccharolobus solfataricus]AZF69114.1 hypothetical protein SULG_12790 [Saccharolobus solfataricus]AZF71734.1 hypothetical protein SULH_12790 [Saccharolobus solfataricus]